jgi:hypothetical protein
METFDWEQFFYIAMAGTPFFHFFITAGVQELKKWTQDGVQVVTGAWLRFAALMFGTVFGSFFMLVTNRPPKSPDWWDALGYAFLVVVYGLLQGFMATKNYDAHKDETEKMVARYQGLVK